MMTTDEPTIIPLSGVEPAGDIEFIQAKWWNTGSRFAVILTRDRRGIEKSLRMDVNKRAFLDHFSDESVDVFVQARATNVWEMIAEARRPLGLATAGASNPSI